ncbi:MAG: outer membrane protein assembly factor BamD [Proteobacteria bacterium]|nr:outer membrane protein assembly factor BamD [Pseudomonadota bacterium]
MSFNRLAASILVVCLILAGCSAKRGNEPFGGGPEKLYDKGLSRFNSGKYQTAIEIFNDVKNYYPESTYASRAEIKIADAHFFLAEYEEAIVIYEEFRKLHPYHEDIPYILFQIGQAYFKQVKSSDRDQTPARKALSNFRYLVENYPPSIFTETAKERIRVCRRGLAEHEFAVGKFYYRKGNYRGAAARFEEIIANYEDTGLVPQALFHLGKAFINLSLYDKAKETFLEITRQYPDSEYSPKAEAILKSGLRGKDATTMLGPVLKADRDASVLSRSFGSATDDRTPSPIVWIRIH